MKLGELRGLIRKTKGNVTTHIQLVPGGPRLLLALQKTPLLEELERVYPGGRNFETGVSFNSETGYIVGGFDSADGQGGGTPAAGADLDLDEDLTSSASSDLDLDLDLDEPAADAADDDLLV
jgi:hypothetical protein